MAKFKPPRKKPQTPQIKAGLPCVILLLLAFVMVSLLFFAMLKGG